MPEILLVNPRKRRKSGKRRTAAQRAATAKMLAANRRRHSGSKRRKNPVSVLHSPNPRRRRRSVARRRNPISLRSLGGGMRAPLAMVKSAAVGAAGAAAVNTIMGKLPLPPSLMTGRVRYLTQGAAAIALGMIASKTRIIGAETAAKMAEGSLVVTLHDAIRDIAGQFGVNLSGMGYYLPGRGVRSVPSASGAPAQMAGMSEFITGPGAPSRNVTAMPARNRMAGVGNITRAF